MRKAGTVPGFPSRCKVCQNGGDGACPRLRLTSPMTIRLTRSLRTWGTPGFTHALKREVEQLEHDALPLQRGLAMGSHVLDNPVSAMVINASETDGIIRAKVGIFYSSILAGCACADDPTPVNENSEYCVVRFDIDTSTGAAQVELLDE